MTDYRQATAALSPGAGPGAAAFGLGRQATEATARGDHAEALRLWRKLQANRPGNRLAATGIVAALVALNRPTIADELLAEIGAHPDLEIADGMLFAAVRALPGNESLAVAHCEALERRGNARAAERRWDALRRQRVQTVRPHLGYIRNVLAQRRLTEADRATTAALKQFPGEPELLVLHARIAELVGSWAVAARRWAVVSAEVPSRTDALQRQRDNQAHAAAGSPPPSDAPAMALPVPKIDLADPGLHDLVIGFENLGYNCEFGLLQRACGANPLGLLRFALTKKGMLLQLLNTRFADIGEAAANELVHYRREYRLRHNPSGWTTHTHKRIVDHTSAAVFKMMLRHTGFLREKLIDELEQQIKICVYEMPHMTDADATEIFDALQAYGPNRLLCVRLSTDTKPAGHIEWPHERLMIAHLDREFDNDAANLSVDYWIHFCRIAAAAAVASPKAGFGAPRMLLSDLEATRL